MGYFRVERGHLRILSDAEAIFRISAYSQAVQSDMDVSLSCWTFIYKQLYFVGFAEGVKFYVRHFELTQSHLKNHIFLQRSLRTDHKKCTCGAG